MDALTKSKYIHVVMDNRKERLPRGRSYVLKPSALASALEGAGVSLENWLSQYRGNWNSSDADFLLFDAYFMPPHPGRPYEALAMRSWAIPSEHAPQARVYAGKALMPEFIDWIRRIVAEPAGSTVRREEQRFVRRWKPEVK